MLRKYVAAGVLGVGLAMSAAVCATASQPYERLLEARTVVLVSLDTPWDSDDSVGASAEPPKAAEPLQNPETASRAFTGDPGASSDLASVPNGSMPQELLRGISFAPGASGYAPAVEALEAMNAAYFAESGRNLGINNMYRPGFQGRSFHGWGLAIDFNGPYGSVLSTDDLEYQWLMTNASAYGYYLPFWADPAGASPEPWHWEFGSYYMGSAADCYSPCPANRPFLVQH